MVHEGKVQAEGARWRPSIEWINIREEEFVGCGTSVLRRGAGDTSAVTTPLREQGCWK